jgi:hypothetical protein
LTAKEKFGKNEFILNEPYQKIYKNFFYLGFTAYANSKNPALFSNQ